MSKQPDTVALARYDAMCAAIAACHKVDEVKAIRDKMLALEIYARQALNYEVERKAVQIRMLAERKAGHLLKETKRTGDRHRGGRSSPKNEYQPGIHSTKTLKDLDITNNEASRWQKLAEIPEEKFAANLNGFRMPSTASFVRLQRDERAQQKRKAKVEATEQAKASGVQTEIRLGDFRTVLASLREVDAVITDPPYGREFVALLADLTLWADKALKKDGGLLAVLFGQSWLPDAFRLLGTVIRPYRWTCCYMTPGPAYVAHDRGVHSQWKPLLIFGGGKDLRFGDVFQSSGATDGKQHHKWGQDFAAFCSIVERLTSPGQLIVDPFAGGGTTLLAAKSLGRHSIGCDLDPEAVQTTQRRLDE
jgi:16S rRNA G966 N2-methylase RsmD